ncbi:hypothetical protein ASG22_19725 [Chryseobacterium sp. Leaf405]|uniref:AAA family ATPase n=1 Tax=Chryseobacterium sp. Leaf405 TaxID=1736367 RepID=UPI0006FB8A64|nr:ATP-binding protein [Chryseobacterium sp. Leaf405]KQT29556.1 hypothetical protein ASG22_19725 [Chryseobacterium sp. Leaf405]
MNFKLLAIRPLKDCDSSFLKNLKENCFYRFYNEYDYEHIKTDNTEISLIDLQNKILQSNVNDLSQKKIDFLEVTQIKYIQEVPDSFYEENINVSAIVGKNGSGKSSILEFLYAFIFNISKKYKILKFGESTVNYNKINLEIYYFYHDSYYKISHKTLKSTIKIEVFKASADSKFLKVINIDEILFKFYSLVINYSIYSLNSKVSGKWVKTLFHKNDGYQSPIVINPFRTDGNVEVNNEYDLAQARLILNHFVIKNDTLIEGIQLKEVNYYLNIKKLQYIPDDENEGKSDKLIIDDIITFLNLNNFGLSENLSSLVDIIFVNKKAANSIKSLKRFLRTENIGKDFLVKNLSTDFKEKISYLCLLYIFKKLKRISYNYGEYEKYHFLFGSTVSEEILKKDISPFKLNFKKYIRYNNDEQYINFGKYVDQLFEFFRSYLKTHPVLNILNEDVYGRVKEILFSSQFDNNSDVNNVIDFIFDTLTTLINDNRVDLFSQYIAQLNRDKTHIAFKYKQAINYFQKNIFGLITVKPVVDENGQNIPDLYKIIIEKKFSGNDIYNIPISFFEPEILMYKQGETYTFNRLSSGEQQMIHSMLNITYHLYNIKSVQQKGQKKKYNHINIIFDEVELYFHPEFQKNFISNLLQNLKSEEFKNFSFNIIFSTHSPFILSDIPTQNILRLNEGIPLIDSDGINSFGANIHDLLADEFFLGGNTVGKFASDKIDKIINFLYCRYKIKEINNDLEKLYFSSGTNHSLINLRKELEKELETFPKYESEEISKIIFMIGEPLISDKLTELFNEVFK